MEESQSSETQQSTPETSTSVPAPVPARVPAPVPASGHPVLPVAQKSLSIAISRLQVMVEVADRYKSLFTQLLYILQDMYDTRDKRLLFDIQPLAAYIRPEKAEGFKNMINEIRNHLNITVKSSVECRKRLVQLRSKLTKNEDLDIIDDALDLLNLPSSAEIQSDADFRLLTLQQSISDVDSSIEIQEIFIYLNNMFKPVDESNSKSSNKSQNKRR